MHICRFYFLTPESFYYRMRWLCVGSGLRIIRHMNTCLVRMGNINMFLLKHFRFKLKGGTYLSGQSRSDSQPLHLIVSSFGRASGWTWRSRWSYSTGSTCDWWQMFFVFGWFKCVTNHCGVKAFLCEDVWYYKLLNS